jgi:nascent polypeptide-associated complex subunit alpha
MFPSLGGLNPKKIQAMMKQLGMNQEEIDALRVIIEKNQGGKIIIENPSVTKISIQGKENFQISGDIREESEKHEIEEEGISEEDIKIVMERTGTTKEKARKALESSEGDLAEAILKLS